MCLALCLHSAAGKTGGPFETLVFHISCAVRDAIQEVRTSLSKLKPPNASNWKRSLIKNLNRNQHKIRNQKSDRRQKAEGEITWDGHLPTDAPATRHPVQAPLAVMHCLHSHIERWPRQRKKGKKRTENKGKKKKSAWKRKRRRQMPPGQMASRISPMYSTRFRVVCPQRVSMRCLGLLEKKCWKKGNATRAYGDSKSLW